MAIKYIVVLSSFVLLAGCGTSEGVPTGSVTPAGTGTCTPASNPIPAGGSSGSSSGSTGSSGAQGVAGPQGPVGPTGPQGAPGAAGSQGPAGAGTPGAQGPEGPAGPAGAVGAVGAQGPQGIQGVPGAVGPQGPAGAGASKASTYSVSGLVHVGGTNPTYGTASAACTGANDILLTGGCLLTSGLSITGFGPGNGTPTAGPTMAFFCDVQQDGTSTGPATAAVNATCLKVP